MIEIEMSKDIREYSPKVLGPFTKRQLAVITLSVLVATPVLVFLHPLSLIIRLILSLILTMPIFLCGWVTMFSMPLEIFVFKFVIPNTINPRKKIYLTENFYEGLFTQKGSKNYFKPKPILRNIPVKKMTKKEKMAIEAKLKKYHSSK